MVEYYNNYTKGEFMFKELIKKITEWALEKEEEAAKKCAIPMEEIEKQLKVLHEKRDELKKKCEEEINELDELIKRVERIKAQEEQRCKLKEH